MQVPKSLAIAFTAAVAAGCAITAGCGGGRTAAPAPAPDQVKVEVSSIGVDRSSGEHYVVLADKAGKRELPILIGDSEARAILLEMHGLHPQRPLTDDLLRDVIEKTGNRVDRVVIGDLRDDTYYASIVLNSGRDTVDSRPSDAIALALGVNAPIYVADNLFPREGAADLEGADGLPETSRALGITVQELTPELGADFGVTPQTGVLISDVDSEAARSGVKRGMVIASIGDRQIRSLRDFEQGTARLRAGDSIEVRFGQGETPPAVTLKVPAAAAESR